jgi:hypothetical protein
MGHTGFQRIHRVKKRAAAVRVGINRNKYSGPMLAGIAIAAGGAEAKRAFGAMMSMKKIDGATIEAARRG